MLEWNGIRVMPCGIDAYGNDMVIGNAAHHFGGDPKAGIVITLIDAWVLRPDVFSQLNCAFYTPIDHEPAPPQVIEHIRQAGAVPIAMSEHGRKAMQKEGLDPLYAPHGFDPAFHPVDRDEARAYLSRHVGEIPQDAFVVGMCAANKGKNPVRKSFPEVIAAFARIQEDIPNALLYFHSEATGAIDGVNLPQLCAINGVPPERVRFVDQFHLWSGSYDTEHLSHVYSAMDVLANPSYGEGFGIPLVEAQACGTPVIATNTTAMTELAGVGWLVEGQKQFTYQGAYMTVPSVDRIEWALREAAKGGRDATRGACVEFADSYRFDHVAEHHWRPVIAELERRFFAPPSVEVLAAEVPVEEVAA